VFAGRGEGRYGARGASVARVVARWFSVTTGPRRLKAACGGCGNPPRYQANRKRSSDRPAAGSRPASRPVSAAVVPADRPSAKARFDAP